MGILIDEVDIKGKMTKLIFSYEYIHSLLQS